MPSRKPAARKDEKMPATVTRVSGKARTLADLIRCVDFLALEAQRAGLDEASLLLNVTALSLQETLAKYLKKSEH